MGRPVLDKDRRQTARLNLVVSASSTPVPVSVDNNLQLSQLESLPVPSLTRREPSIRPMRVVTGT
jgi:hypothetical protein